MTVISVAQAYVDSLMTPDNGRERGYYHTPAALNEIAEFGGEITEARLLLSSVTLTAKFPDESEVVVLRTLGDPMNSAFNAYRVVKTT